jgi:hypothetical protein
MAAVVPMARTEPEEAEIRIGVGMSSTDTAIQLAKLGNWLRGTGAQIVAGCCPEYQVGSGATRIFRFRTVPRKSAIQRIWVFSLRTAATVVVEATIKSPASTGTAVTYRVPSGRSNRIPFVYTQDLAAKTQTEAEVNFEVTTSGGTCEVEAIACYEQTRAALNKDADDIGIDTETCRPGQPIRGVDYESIEGIHDLVTTADARRVAIFHWAVPEEGAVTRTTASYQALFDLAVPVLAPLTNSGETTAVASKVLASVYAKVAGGAGGQVRLTTDGSGVAKVFTVTSTSFGWSATEIIACDVDDMTASDGRRSTRFDGLQVEYQGDGTNALSLAGVSVWVASVA